MPIRWDEPFGMVMIEALATGTPVIAFPEGAASEIVIDGYNGRLAAEEPAIVPLAGGSLGVSDGIRTRDRRDHNPANPVVWAADLAL